MEIVNLVKEIIWRNKIFASILIVAAITCAFIHNNAQNSVYISDFEITNGEIDYSSFKSLNDFKEPDSSIYHLGENGLLEQITNRLKVFNVSYVQNGKVGINFKLTTLIKGADHNQISKDILSLLNDNILIKNSVNRQLESLNKKLSFIERKINELDSIMINNTGNFALSKIPSDSYNLYSEQLDLENEISTLANFEVIKPVTKITEHRRPLTIYLFLYLFFAGLIFTFFSKKKVKSA